MFKVGDKVKILEGGSYGHVIEIGSLGEVKKDQETSEYDGKERVLVDGYWSEAGEYIGQYIDPSELELVK